MEYKTSFVSFMKDQAAESNSRLEAFDIKIFYFSHYFGHENKKIHQPTTVVCLFVWGLLVILFEKKMHYVTTSCLYELCFTIFKKYFLSTWMSAASNVSVSDQLMFICS